MYAAPNFSLFILSSLFKSSESVFQALKLYLAIEVLPKLPFAQNSMTSIARHKLPVLEKIESTARDKPFLHTQQIEFVINTGRGLIRVNKQRLSPTQRLRFEDFLLVSGEIHCWLVQRNSE